MAGTFRATRGQRGVCGGASGSRSRGSVGAAGARPIPVTTVGNTVERIAMGDDRRKAGREQSPRGDRGGKRGRHHAESTKRVSTGDCAASAGGAERAGKSQADGPAVARADDGARPD